MVFGGVQKTSCWFFAPFVLHNRCNCRWLLVCCGLLVGYYCCCIFLRVWSVLVVETLKGGLLHSIGVMIVYVFVLHLSHTCLFNFFIFLAEMRWCTEVCGNPQGSPCFCLLVFGLFGVVVDLLLWILSAVWWCVWISRRFLALNICCNYCCCLLVIVVCFFIYVGSVMVRGGVWRSEGGSLHSAVATRRRQDTPHRNLLGSPTFFSLQDKMPL